MRTQKNMKLKKLWNNDELRFITEIDLCTNVDGRTTELQMNGYQNLTYEMQKKFLTLGNLSLRNKNCKNKTRTFYFWDGSITK